MLARVAVALALVLALAAVPGRAAAQPEPATATTVPASALRSQGVAVLGTNGAREAAYGLARAIYGTASLRPRSLDELHARILAGDASPPTASKELRELAELRASITGDDAASRRLLASIAQQLGVQGILVVSVVAPAGPAPAGSADAGAAPVAVPGTTTTARLFLAETGDFDAARYEPTHEPGADSSSPWRGTVTSLSGRLPPAAAGPVTGAVAVPVPATPAKLTPDGKEGRPFYKSPWLWAAVGAAVLIGGIFFFAAQDTTDDPIHLRMSVPR